VFNFNQKNIKLGLQVATTHPKNTYNQEQDLQAVLIWSSLNKKEDLTTNDSNHS
jgi:hypothetical protein